MRQIRITPIVLIAASLLAACAPSAAPTAEATQEPLPIKIVLTPFISNAPVYIAAAEGYFEAAGLAPEYVPIDRAAEGIPALSQGDVDVSSGSLTASLLNAVAQGANIKLVADKGVILPDDCFTGVMASPEVAAAGGLDNPEAIYGKTVRYSEGSISHYWLETAFENRGLDFSQMERVDMPVPAIPEALESGELALALTGEPIITQARQAGQGVYLMSYAEDLPNFQYGFLMFGPSILDENPELGRRFMTAYLRALRQYEEGKTERNIEILSEALDFTPEFMEEVCWLGLRSDLGLQPEDVMAFQAWGVEKGLIESPISIEQLIDTQFIEYALETVGE